MRQWSTGSGYVAMAGASTGSGGTLAGTYNDVARTDPFGPGAWMQTYVQVDAALNKLTDDQRAKLS